MSRLRGGLIVAGVLLAGNGAAQDAPLVLPTRDVAVSYKLIGRGGPKNLVIRQRAQSRVMRIETIGQPGYVLVDRQTQRASLVMDGQGVFADMAANRVPQEGQLPDDNASFKKRGLASFAGSQCTNWDYNTARGNGRVCITDDGVLLRIESLSGNGLEATTLAFVPQQAAWFTPPAGTSRMGSLVAPPPIAAPPTNAATAAAKPISLYGGAPATSAPLVSIPGVPGYAPTATALPPGMQLPPGLKIPPTVKLPPNFKLPPGVQLPAGMTLPSSN